MVTRDGQIAVSSLAAVEVTAGPTEIRHRDRVRTVTLVIRRRTCHWKTPWTPCAVVIAPLMKAAYPGVKLRMSGTANKLTQTWEVMVFDLAMALIIVYLVMAVLFESFFYPLIIMFSVRCDRRWRRRDRRVE